MSRQRLFNSTGIQKRAQPKGIVEKEYAGVHIGKYNAFSAVDIDLSGIRLALLESSIAMDITNDELAQRLKRFLEVSRSSTRDVQVSNIRRFFGGSSKPTYRADFQYSDRGGEQMERIVVRVTPVSSLVDHSRDSEAQMLRLMNGREFNVPKVFEVVDDPRVIGAPFFIMEEISGCETAQHLLLVDPYAKHRNAIGEQKWRLLGQLARYDLTQDERSHFEVVSTETAWEVELDKWATYYHSNAQEPEPLVDRTLRWLRANPPPPAPKLSFVHGDFRTGNFLFDQEGKIRGILDWEMAHVGDPHEDIAWAICPSWGWADHDRPGLLITKAQAFAIWEEASGLSIDAHALYWWSLFTTVKGVALWAACARNLLQNGAHNTVELAGCWFPRDVHLRLMAQLLFKKEW